jgi:hypothetical protein
LVNVYGAGFWRGRPGEAMYNFSGETADHLEARWGVKRGQDFGRFFGFFAR